MTSPAAGTEWSTRRRAGIVVGLTAIAVVPMVVSIVRMMFGPKYFPGIDIATIELRVRDALHEAVLVGPYSRYGWDHPGPFLYYLLAVPYWLSGRASVSLPITAAAVNAACVVGSVRIGWRRLGLRGALGVLVPMAVLVRALGPERIRDPWNPYLPILPLILFLLAVWAVAEQDWWWSVPAILVGSFVVQTHVGFAGVVGATAFVGVGFGVVRRRRTPTPRRWGPAVSVAAVALVVVWLPVAYGRFVRDDGNLSRMVQFFSADHATAGLTKALGVMGLQWGTAPEWILGARTTARNPFPTEPHWYLAVWVLAAAAGAVVAHRRGDRVVTTLGWIALVALVATVASVAQVVGPMWPYIVRWTWAIGVLLGMVAILGLVGSFDRRRAPQLVGVAGALVIGLTCASTVAVVGADGPDATRAVVEQALSTQVLRHLPPGPGSVMIDRNQSTFALPGLMLQLERHGIDTVVTPPLEVVYGEHRSRMPGSIRARLVVVDGSKPAPVPSRKIASYRRRDSHGRVDHIEVYLLPPP